MAKYAQTAWCLLLMLTALVMAVGSGSARAAEGDTHDPCSLLTQAEVEAVMGPLAGPPFRGDDDGNPRANGRLCVYEAPDRRSIHLEVAWKDGRNQMGMLGSMQALTNAAGLSQLKLADGTTIAGHWEQAHLNNCCQFWALRDDRLLIVDIGGSKATIAQAASLADAAIQRLDTPLPITGEAGYKPAQERAALRPKQRSVCDLVTQADAEAIVGSRLTEPPKGTRSRCLYMWSPASGQLLVPGKIDRVELMVSWRGGFSEFRMNVVAVGNATSMMGFGKAKAPVSASQLAAPWDEISQSMIGVSAVKGDVLVSSEGGPFGQDTQKAFIVKALGNLDK